MSSYEEKLERSKKYYWSHREERLEYNRLYCLQRKAYLKKYHQDRWEKIKTDRAEMMRQYYARNQERYRKEQSVIRAARMARGWSQKNLGDKVGVTATCISHYELGRVKAPWDELYVVMPELKEARENEETHHQN